MEISDASAVGAVVSLCAVVGSLGGIIYKTLSSAIAALEKRVSQTEAKADSCEKDREDVSKSPLLTAPSHVAPLRFARFAPNDPSFPTSGSPCAPLRPLLQRSAYLRPECPAGSLAHSLPF
jgi:hypothetical protein